MKVVLDKAISRVYTLSRLAVHLTAFTINNFTDTNFLLAGVSFYVYMRYLGNKTRLSRELYPILSKNLTGNNFYFEPFAGACGMMQAFNNYPKCVASDIDFYIVALMAFLSNGGRFDDYEINETLYNQVKNDKESYPTALVGFLGYGCSFGGKWFSGYARGGKQASGKDRDYAAESLRNIYKLSEKVKDVSFVHSDYKDLVFGKGNVIYCDIPYGYAKSTTKYKQGDFNHEEFFRIMQGVAYDNFVYVSEYTAPNNWDEVWSKDHIIGIHHGFTNHKSSTEKLFTFSVD